MKHVEKDTPISDPDATITIRSRAPLGVLRPLMQSFKGPSSLIMAPVPCQRGRVVEDCLVCRIVVTALQIE